MKKLFGLVNTSPLALLTSEYIVIGVVVSMFSALLGFYSAAFIIADKCYPELSLQTVQLVHRDLFHNMPLAIAVYGLMIFALYWFFARSQVKKITELAQQRQRGN